MYMGIKLMIKINGMSTDFFTCNVGVRQGENLSPFLLALYINDLEYFLQEKGIIGLQSITNSIEEELMLYLKLLILLYADDTVIMAESADDLQYALNEFFIYCTQWKLNVNVDKTKFLIFSKGPLMKRQFYYNGGVIENVKEFKYLGIIFSRSGSFCKAKKHLCEQAQKAMYGIIRKIRLFDLPISCQFDLFDKVVLPVLIYGCEIWGYENLQVVERIHLKFLKHIFQMKSSTPSFMVYGETGRFPIYINVYSRMISYWATLLQGCDFKIVNVLHKFLHTQYLNGTVKNPWFECIQRILSMCGLSNIWNQQKNINGKWITNIVKQRLQDQFIQTWSSDMFNSSKGKIYRTFKIDFGPEKYLEKLSKKFRANFLKFRTTNHRLPIETGRWIGIPYNERFCVLCNESKIADEFHYILECSTLSNIRKEYLHKKEMSTDSVKKSKVKKTTISDKRHLVSTTKRKFQPLAEYLDTADKHKKRDHLQSLGSALKDVLPNACLFKGLQVQTKQGSEQTQRSNEEQVLRSSRENSHDKETQIDNQNGLQVQTKGLEQVVCSKTANSQNEEDHNDTQNE
ncbi:uncharacterized protein LOC130053469 [Ostrea edulis]|uniref:uncharacterized protein LOC130053469 n=1 Tax=Ostrea edulis TaxID=37623 RepID=UPI0024AF3902|nr:uncharacterized protein LOC130053469 [Ostrea edulis]